eukprot:GDKI01005606.1.p1 GENE.GDKI01005606.1~~GDKI01005606.1.p1  ORF type:complete len:151 (-),score=5.85 GDKI01005606.1:690-1142(-)
MSDDITVKAMEQVHLLVSGVNNRLDPGEYLFERSKTCFNPSILVSHGLVTVRADRMIPVRLMNTGNTPVRIYKGTILGELTQLPSVSVSIVTVSEDPMKEQKPMQGDGSKPVQPEGTATGLQTPVQSGSKTAQGAATGLQTSVLLGSKTA